MTEAELAAWLLTINAANRYDLLTITTRANHVLRWTDCDIPLTLSDGRVFTPEPNFERSRLTLSSDLSIDNMDLSLYTTASHVIGGQPALVFAQRGGLDAAEVKVEWLWTDTAGTIKGWHERFTGTAGPAEAERGHITLNIRSELARLNMPIPTQVYRPGCANTVYDPQCGLSRAAWQNTGAVVASGTNSLTRVLTNLAQAAGTFDLGVIAFTSGLNAGLSRTIKAYAGGEVMVSLPWVATPQAGDAFTIRRGCDGQVSTCTNVFNNRLHFRGEPWVPAAETAA